MTYVDLDVVGDWLGGAFQKVGQAVIHQLHKQNRQSSVEILVRAQVLHNVWMLYSAQELILLLKSPDWQPVLSVRCYFM